MHLRPLIVYRFVLVSVFNILFSCQAKESKREQFDKKQADECSCLLNQQERKIPPPAPPPIGAVFSSDTLEILTRGKKYSVSCSLSVVNDRVMVQDDERQLIRVQASNPYFNFSYHIIDPRQHDCRQPLQVRRNTQRGTFNIGYKGEQTFCSFYELRVDEEYERLKTIDSATSWEQLSKGIIDIVYQVEKLKI